MSEREDEGTGSSGSGFGPFLLGVSLGAVLGYLFAPEPGTAARGRLAKRLRGLRGLAAEKVGELGQLLDAAEAAEDEAPSARAALERRLSDAKRRRRARPTAGLEQEDEPVA
ncbi:MAG TPA: YtxH domain-containing protein [Gemmatimonadales bacterium]|nr:YtxH domain-containing protein [Gemmatimonadales bacterium]